MVGPVNANARFGVFSDTFLEEVCFALKANRFHPFERVPDFEMTFASKAKEESIRAEFDVVAHHGGVHPDRSTGRASMTNSISIATVLRMISTIRDSGSRFTSFE